MDKLSAIGNDVYVGASATVNFWKHISQLLLELGTFGYLQFELEREKISEASLKEINGRYLKFKVKPKGALTSGTEPDVELTELGQSTLMGHHHDASEGFEGLTEDSDEFRE